VLAGCAPENSSAEVEANLEKRQPETPPRLIIEPGAVVFPRSFVGQPTTASVSIFNEGESLTQVELSIPRPFTVGTASLNLPPGAGHTVELSLDPKSPGPAGAVLLLQAGTRRIELTVKADVEPAPQPTGP
jgi:hypothetical protein